MQNTIIKRYGVNVGFYRKSNGKKITKPQTEVFNYIKFKYDNDTELEKLLLDVKISVDIYIPSKHTVVEINGDYWHMNPILFKESNFNKSTKKQQNKLGNMINSEYRSLKILDIK